MLDVAVDFVEYLAEGGGVDEATFSDHATNVLTTLFTFAADDSRQRLGESIAAFMQKKGRRDADESLRTFFSTLRTTPIAQSVSYLNDIRRRWVIARAQSTVPITAFVFSCSLVWSTGHKLDFVVAPGAPDAANPLSLGYMSTSFPRILDQFLEQIALQGLDQARVQDAYVVDELRCRLLLQELDRFVQRQPLTERAAYASIVERIRLSLSAVDDAFFDAANTVDAAACKK